MTKREKKLIIENLGEHLENKRRRRLQIKLQLRLVE